MPNLQSTSQQSIPGGTQPKGALHYKRTLEAKQPTMENQGRTSYWHWGVVLLVVLLFAFIRFRVRDIPLERDEGEYAYAGQLILQGIPPYQLAYNMKLPGTYAAYAVILAVFGQTSTGIHYGLLLVNAATTLLVYFLAARLFGRLAAVIASASHALLSTGESVLGLAGHATHFVVLMALGAILLLLKGIESRRIGLFFWSGVLAGLAFLMKQPGIFFVLFCGLYLLQAEVRNPVDWRGLMGRVGAFSFGAALPFGLTCLWLFRAGVFRNFWFWTFSYASQYATSVGFAEGLHELWTAIPRVVGPSVWIWIMAAAGLTVLFWNPKIRPHAILAGGFLLFSFLAVCPGLNFRAHYFILILPAVSLLAGVAVSSATDALREGHHKRTLQFVPAVLFVAAFAYSVFQQRAFFFEMEPQAICRAVYHENPFPEALRIADYLKTHTPKDAKIAVLGSEPEIFFYSERHSATGYIYTYGLMERQKYALQMQKEAVNEIEAAHPEFIVLVDVPVSWGVRPYSETFILAWAKQYLEAYEQVGIAEILEKPEYHWDSEAKVRQPRALFTVRVLKRKS